MVPDPETSCILPSHDTFYSSIEEWKPWISIYFSFEPVGLSEAIRGQRTAQEPLAQEASRMFVPWAEYVISSLGQNQRLTSWAPYI